MAVFVLDPRKRPLMPCSAPENIGIYGRKCAQSLLERGRTVAHRLIPFTLRMRDRTQDDCVLPSLKLTLDPDGKTTGIALSGKTTVVNIDSGEIKVHRHALALMGLHHRVDTTTSRVQRSCRQAPVTSRGQELVRFDLPLLQDSEISGVEYQLGAQAKKYNAVMVRKTLTVEAFEIEAPDGHSSRSCLQHSRVIDTKHGHADVHAAGLQFLKPLAEWAHKTRQMNNVGNGVCDTRYPDPNQAVGRPVFSKGPKGLKLERGVVTLSH